MNSRNRQISSYFNFPPVSDCLDHAVTAILVSRFTSLRSRVTTISNIEQIAFYGLHESTCCRKEHMNVRRTYTSPSCMHFGVDGLLFRFTIILPAVPVNYFMSAKSTLWGAYGTPVSIWRWKTWMGCLWPVARLFAHFFTPLHVWCPQREYKPDKNILSSRTRRDGTYLVETELEKVHVPKAKSYRYIASVP